MSIRLLRRVAALMTALWAVILIAPQARATLDPTQRQVDEALEAWNLAEAEATLARLESSGASDAGTVYLRGKLLFMQGRYRESLEWLGQARSLGDSPAFEQLEALVRSTEEVTRPYMKVRSPAGHFELSHAPGVDALLVPYAGEALDRAYTELTRIFGHAPPTPIRVEIYPTVDVLGAVSPLTVAEIRTSGTIALCKYNRLMITSPRDLVYGYDWLDTLAHELIHLIVTQKSRNRTPIWLHEGLAKYYEVKWRRDARPSLDRHSESFLAKALAKGTLIPFADMSPSMAKLPSQEATATAFAEVWTVMAFLEGRAGGPVASALTGHLGAGLSDRDAVGKVANLPWDRFEPSWKAWLKGQGYRPLDAEFQQRLLFKGKDTEADELAEIRVDKARDHVWLGDRLRLGGRWAAAIHAYRRATEVVGRESPLIQGKLGYALLRAKRAEEAVEELRRPIAEHPRHVVLQVYLGEALLTLGRHAEARAHLEEALTINPFDPDLHGHLAAVYEKLGLTEKAAVERNAHRLIHP
jgi:tetratricopeptide (TPR) repeat protein